MGEVSRRFWERPIAHYLGGVLAVLGAFLIREGVSFAAGPDFSQYVVFYPAVMSVALLAGLWPSLVATLTAAGLLVILRVIPWRILPFSSQATNLASLGFFVAVCAFLAVVAELSRRNRLKAAAYDKEKALRQSNALLHLQAELLRLSFDAIIVWKIEGGIESWNRGAEELYGFSEQEALGQGVHGLLKTACGTPWPQFEQMVREQGRWHGELQHMTRDGRTVTVSSRLHIGHSAEGELRVLQIDRDITEQKRTQSELRQAHHELENKVLMRTAQLQAANRMLMMVSACDQALVQISDERELIAVICQIIQDEGGYPLVWVGLTDGPQMVRCVASAGDRDGYLDSLRALGGEASLATGPAGTALRSGQTALMADLIAETGDDPWRREAVTRGFREAAALPLLRNASNVLGVLVIYSYRSQSFDKNQMALLDEIVNDLAFGVLSLRARAERDQALRAVEMKAIELRVLAGELVRAEQRERQRIARLLHDQLQQLLVAALYGLSDLRAQVPQPAREQVVSRIDGLLRECIAVSRSLTSELGHPALAEPDFAAGLDWLSSWMKENHGLEVSVHCPEPLMMPAEDTRTTLLQAVRELLFNVVKHAEVRTAEVSVEVTREERVAVTVSDSGVGFDLAGITPLGDRAPGAAQRGIGLVSVRERLALIGGGIDVKSSPGRGSQVTVWVPAGPLETGLGGAASTGPSDDSAPRAAARLAGDDRIRVLLVDDHAVVREGLALQLRQQADMEVVGEAADGSTAIEMVGSLRPDIVTMDISMPGIGGVEATRRIHAAYPEVLVIGLSMADDARQAASMREAGAVLHFSKSSSLDDLLEAIRSCAGRRPRSGP